MSCENRHIMGGHKKSIHTSSPVLTRFRFVFGSSRILLLSMKMLFSLAGTLATSTMRAEADADDAAAVVGATPTSGGLAASAEWLSELLEKGPCRNSNEPDATTYDSLLQQQQHHRRLDDDAPPPLVWETVVVAVTLVLMLLFMSFDNIRPDWVMVTGLVIFMVTEIVTVKEGLAGFSNEGIMTVMSLFIVAEGISRTGALDYYMGKLLGTPKTIAGASTAASPCG